MIEPRLYERLPLDLLQCISRPIKNYLVKNFCLWAEKRRVYVSKSSDDFINIWGSGTRLSFQEVESAHSMFSQTCLSLYMESTVEIF